MGDTRAPNGLGEDLDEPVFRTRGLSFDRTRPMILGAAFHPPITPAAATFALKDR